MSDTHSHELPKYIRSLSDELSPIRTELQPQLEGGVNTNLIKAILLDVYGTLFISGTGDISLTREAHDGEALTAALKDIYAAGDVVTGGEKGVKWFREEIKLEHNRAHANGLKYPEIEIREIWRKVLHRLIAQGIVNISPNKKTIEKLATGFECRVNPVWPMPGLKELLINIRSRNIPCGIVSNAQFFTPMLFDAFLFQSVEKLGFDPELCSWSFKIRRAKPDPELFKKSLEKLAGKYDILPEQTLYLGNDCLNDISGARNTGCQTALFAGDKRSLRLREDNAECTGLSPDYILTDLMQLLSLIRNS